MSFDASFCWVINIFFVCIGILYTTWSLNLYYIFQWKMEKNIHIWKTYLDPSRQRFSMKQKSASLILQRTRLQFFVAWRSGIFISQFHEWIIRLDFIVDLKSLTRLSHYVNEMNFDSCLKSGNFLSWVSFERELRELNAKADKFLLHHIKLRVT